MTDTLQLEPPVIAPLDDGPKLLVDWPPRWEEFKSNVGPAFAKSGRHLAGEAPLGLLPYRGMIASFILQAILIFLMIVVPREIDHLRPYAAPRVRPDEVIYYSGDELPRTADVGGAQSGASARAGGRHAHHNSQTIKVSRGASLANQVVDAPSLKLPPNSSAVANLLAMRSVTGTPSAEGLHSLFKTPDLAANVVAPAMTNITREPSRRGISLNSIVAPAPDISAESSRRTPALNAAVVAPAPTVASEHTLYAPKLESSIVAPAPSLSRDRHRAAPDMNASVIAPASTAVSREQARNAPRLNGQVIAPAPNTTQHELSSSRVRMNDVNVVPPPVSAPERESTRVAKLNMPAQSVVAPPPSADMRDLRRMESGRLPSASPNVVPPPPTPAANGSFVSSVIGKLFGTQDVVPPPPSVSSSSVAGSSRNANGGAGSSLAANVIPPPPSIGSGSNNSAGGTGRKQNSPGMNAGSPNVIPPAPGMSGSGNGNGQSGARNGGGANAGNGAVLANNAIPPPPSLDSGNGASGSGRRGSGLGAPGDIGSGLNPKAANGNGDNSGVVLSPNPGSKAGLPGTGGKGSLALSPSGGDKPGVGGAGSGSSIGNGAGTGSALAGNNPANAGAGKSGAGRGSDPSARGGISPLPGPGGTGSAPSGTPPAPGVNVSGGSTNSVVNLPSFDSSNSNAPNLPGRTNIKTDPGPAITIVATSRSGGAFNFYGQLPGDNYTVYVDTNLGTAVMQFAEADPNAPHTGALIGPQGIRTSLPENLPHARVVIKCKLDSSGNLSNLQVLEAGPANMTAKIIAALPSWKFRPALRGQQPVEVNAILGFNINTDDRY